MNESEETDPPRSKFRTRYLTDKDAVFDHNAWDDVEWDSEQEEQALKKVKENSEKKFNESQREDLEKNADQYWDKFYGIHQNRFFKDRHWLFVEFPELDVEKNPKTNNETTKIFELGCGVGNTIFPILQNTSSNNIYLYGCDFSKTAINILKNHSLYDETRCFGFVCDVTADDWDAPFKENSLDIAIMIFVLSAISPEKFSHVISKVKNYLKPGGQVLFRDYGRYDMAQLRFKNGRCISDNFYARGDSTRVYFFTQNEVRDIFQKEGFIEEENIVDRRLQVNREKLLKMYRVWIQAKYRKPVT